MIKNHARRAFLKKSLSLLSTLTLYGCGGSGGGGSSKSGSSGTEPTPVVRPSIASQPEDIIAGPGDNAVFQVIAEGSEPLSYQWQRNGIDIIDATDRSYATSPLMPGDDARYSVSVSNSAGSTVSREAQLTILENFLTIDSTIITIDSTMLTVDSV